MNRPQMLINVPEEYQENEKKGLCKVCGKQPSEFEKGRRAYCSQKCSDIYSQCFKSWTGLRDRIIKRDGKCLKCGYTNEKLLGLEVDHIVPFKAGGNMWDESNLQTLCHSCHLKKTKQDLHTIKRHKNKDGNLNLFAKAMKEVGK